MSGHRAQHALVIGIDGVRHDTLQAEHTPALDAIAAAGFGVPVDVDARNPTISGPVWATVASGVYSDEHRITGNDLRGHRLHRFGDFLDAIGRRVPGSDPAAMAVWPPLLTATEGGPVFSRGGYCPPEVLARTSLDAESFDEVAASALGDDAVVGYAARHLRHRRAVATFVYLGHPDVVAHRSGVGPAYREAIRVADEQVGVLMAAIQARPARAQEEWTIIAVTDHGHRDEGGHGGDSPQERRAWMIATGPGLDAAAGAGADHADIHPHVLSLFGLAPDPPVRGRPWVPVEQGTPPADSA